MSLAAVLVALSGGALAVFISSAAARTKSFDTYTQYCENGTNTTYPAYSSDCPKTVTPPTHNGLVVPTVASLVAGEILAPGVTVTAVSKYGVAIDDHGTVVGVVAGSELSAAPDGTLLITKGTKTLLTQYFVLPVGQTTKALSYFLPLGATFGTAKTKLSAISKLFTLYTTTKLTALRVSPHATVTKVKSSVTAAAKLRGHATVTASKALRIIEVKLNLSKITYTKARAKYYKTHPTLAAHLTFKTNTKKSHLFTFTYTY